MKRKQALAVILALAILLSNVGASAFASTESPVSREERKEEIMEQYIQELHNTLAASPVGRSASSSFENVAVDTVAQLNALGYTAYNVNPQNVEEVEAALNTDLEQAGLPADDFYIILIEGDDEEAAQGATRPYSDTQYSDEYKYTYSGKTYRMRWMTVYPTSDSQLTLVNDVTCFGKGLSTAGAVIGALGRVVSFGAKHSSSDKAWIVREVGNALSFLGTEIQNYVKNNPEKSELLGRASSSWTRRYTQVYDGRRSSWMSRCYVEEVNQKLGLQVWYWNSSKHNNDYKNVPMERVEYSDKRNDKIWRQDSAAKAHEIDSLINDGGIVSVRYEYGKDGDNGKKVILCTHNRKVAP